MPSRCHRGAGRPASGVLIRLDVHLGHQAVVAREGVPGRWDQALRWCRRLSREVTPRGALADQMLSGLMDLRALSGVEELCQYYVAREAGWAPGDRWALPEGATRRRVEDWADGLCWVELTQHAVIDPRRSLVPQFSLPQLAARVTTS